MAVTSLGLNHSLVGQIELVLLWVRNRCLYTAFSEHFWWRLRPYTGRPEGSDRSVKLMRVKWALVVSVERAIHCVCIVMYCIVLCRTYSIVSSSSSSFTNFIATQVLNNTSCSPITWHTTGIQRSAKYHGNRIMLFHLRWLWESLATDCRIRQLYPSAVISIIPFNRIDCF